MTDRRSTTRARTRLATRALRLAGGAVIASLVIAGTTGAIGSGAVAQQQQTRAHTLALIDTGHRAGAASLREQVSDAALTAAIATAKAEIARATALLGTSAGKASSAGRAALTGAIDAVTARLGDSSAYRVTEAVMTLRENEKAVADSVAAWQKAEDARQAAAQAARAAEIAAQEYASTRTTSASSWSAPAASASSASVTRSAAPYYAPGVSHTRPSNDPCGPCPGATLVLIQGYWGCPS